MFVMGMLSYEAGPLLWRRLLASWFSTNPDDGIGLRQAMEQQSQAIREAYEVERQRAQEAEGG